MNRTTAILATALALSLGVLGVNAASGLGAGQPSKNAADPSSAPAGRHQVISLAGADRRAPARVTTYVMPSTDDGTSFNIRLPRIAPGTYEVSLTAILASATDGAVCDLQLGKGYTALSYGTYISGFSVGHSSGFFHAKAGHHYVLGCFANTGVIAFSSGSDASSVTLTRVTDRKVVRVHIPVT